MLSSLSLNPKLWCTLCALAVAMVVAAPLRAQDGAATEEAADGAPAAEMAAEEEVEEAEAPPTIESLSADLAAFQGDVDTLWTCLAAFLVFFMQAGFALVECGFTRAKNACNIIMKNLMDFSVGSLVFWLVGFGLMFGTTNGFCGTTLFFFDGASEAALEANSNVGFNWAFLIFQTVFAATAATIVSGAMAERTKFVSYLCYSFLIILIVYPIFGSWCWGGLYAGGGWLEGMGFLDFAGSTVVHSVGGWAALAGAIVIGPRIGKYTADGKIKPIPGHNIPLAALGVFILWLGWFGFNPGSTTAVGGGSFAYIAVTTNLSAAAGAISALAVSWIMFKKPDTSFALNGALAGLVGITAGCDIMSPMFAAVTGLVAGVLVVFSCVFFDKIKVDDPVGAVSVHGVCGAWGTLAIGLWAGDVGILTGGGSAQLITQAIGVAAGFGWAFGTSLVIFLLLKFTIGLRVPAEEEIKGLDITEHGMYAYPPHLVSESLGGTPSGSPATSPSTSGAVTHGA
ncbi:ammonium transporter [Blastopirellula sp. J2-11]|uniref:ammonium transporter n=1 Tax=Blastopirellula sp. J2-11 TaxID=2943192 RepID=UPI0021CA1E94|nr:ammonium transporter [Blastopirellula sp. J2-11]UUO07962.1 ammonium transporter [Blastopirellula sp. J2-11]